MTWKFVTWSQKKTSKVAAVLRANPNPPQAMAPRALQATTNKDKIAPSFGTRNRNSN